MPSAFSGLTPDAVAAARPAVQALVGDFRTHAQALVDAARAARILAAYDAHEEYDDAVVALGSRWWVHLHDPHGRFQSRDHGTVVEAHLYRPELLDAGFLLTFAQTRGGHDAVLDACPAGFHDMVVLLDDVEPDWEDPD